MKTNKNKLQHYTKHITHTKKSPHSLYAHNLYALNCGICNNTSDEAEQYKINILITRISNLLKDNQWIKVSKFPPPKLLTKPIKLSQNIETADGYKPNALWYSKGEWLFSEMTHCKWISIIDVDYKSIYKITNAKPDNYNLDKHYYDKLDAFINEYCTTIKAGRHSGISNKEWNEETIKEYQTANWSKLAKSYDGFAIWPMPPRKYFTSEWPKQKKILNVFTSWDVASLTLWDTSRCILKERILEVPDKLEDDIAIGKWLIKKLQNEK